MPAATANPAAAQPAAQSTVKRHARRLPAGVRGENRGVVPPVSGERARWLAVRNSLNAGLSTHYETRDRAVRLRLLLILYAGA